MGRADGGLCLRSCYFKLIKYGIVDNFLVRVGVCNVMEVMATHMPGGEWVADMHVCMSMYECITKS